MRPAALNPGKLIRLTTDGVAEMPGLLTPAECHQLAPPPDVTWEVEEPKDQTGRSWSHTQYYGLGSPEVVGSPPLRSLLLGFREVVQSNAQKAGIHELESWGSTSLASRARELLGARGLLYGVRWNRTPASHEIGWHSDDTFDEAEDEEGLRALCMMVAINLTKRGGSYEYAPAATPTDPESRTPLNVRDIHHIGGVHQGDAISFCTAKNARGQRWPGSFPLHHFVADDAEPSDDEEEDRVSLILAFQDIPGRSLKEVGLSGLVQGVKHRLMRA